MKKRSESVRGTVRVAAAARLVAALSGVGARVAAVLLSGGALVVFALVALALGLGGCRQSFDYYNPLDPTEDGPISEILPLIEDGAIRQAIIDSGAQRKSELGWLNVEGGVYGNVTTTAGVEFLSYTNDLRLAGVGLETVDLEPLQKMRNLRGLDLAHNQFLDQGVSALPHFPSIDRLSLWDTGITDAAAVAVMLGRYRVGQLSIDIGGSPIDLATLTDLRPVLDRLHGLNIIGIDPTGVALLDLSFLASNSTIDHLNLNRNPGIENYSHLSLLSSLGSLHLEETAMTPARLQTIPDAAFTRFYFLNLRLNGNLDLSALASRLGTVDRRQMSLEIGDNAFGAGDLWNLTPVMDRLHGLGLNWWNGTGPITDLGFFPSNDTIHWLSLGGNLLNDINGIRQLSRLEHLSINNTYNGFQHAWGSEALLDLPNLRYVDAWDSCVEPWVLEELSRRGVWVSY